VTYSQGHRCDAVAARTRATGSPIITGASATPTRKQQWSKAEADMRKALELQPEQPHVLNYLGYSWLDQGIISDEGMKMIKRASISALTTAISVDSLGWAYTASAITKDAVKQSRARDRSQAEDPTINDHLGRRLLRIGRTLEAKFQWAHARDLKPEAGRTAAWRSKPRSKTGCLRTPRPPRPPRTEKRRRQGRLSAVDRRAGRRCRR